MTCEASGVEKTSVFSGRHLSRDLNKKRLESESRREMGDIPYRNSIANLWEGSHASPVNAWSGPGHSAKVLYGCSTSASKACGEARYTFGYHLSSKSIHNEQKRFTTFATVGQAIFKCQSRQRHRIENDQMCGATS